MKNKRILLKLISSILFFGFFGFFIANQNYLIKDGKKTVKINEEKNYIKDIRFLNIEDKFKEIPTYSKLIDEIKKDGIVKENEFLLALSYYFKIENEKKLKEKIKRETEKKIKNQLEG